MELFGLRDRNGLEYKLVTDSPAWEILPLPAVTEPEFKIGDWVIAVCNSAKNFRYLLRFERRSGEHYCGLFVSIGGSTAIPNGYFDYIERHATPKEIESHLRKICDEKYIGKKVADSFSGTCGYARYFDFYDFKTDCVYYKNFGNGVCVYRQGKFAEIILDKRPLPKTKEELKDTLFRFNQKYSRTPLADTLTEFLEDYED